MYSFRRKISWCVSLTLVVLGVWGCEERKNNAPQQITPARATTQSQPSMVQPLTGTSQPADLEASVPSFPMTDTSPISAVEVRALIPDPNQVGNTDLPQRKQVYLSLEEAIRRTLRHSLQILVEGYNPAIKEAEVVEAESIFDAVFFLQAGYNNQDSASYSPYTNNAAQTETYSVNGGIRQLLPTGAMVQISSQLSQTFTDPYSSGIFTPTWNCSQIAELRQPLLRNFGLDVNRAQINIKKNDRKIGLYTFSRKVRQTLYDVNQRYWELVGRRRDLVISRELLEQTKQTLETLDKRRDIDALQVQIARTKALLGTREADFIRAVNAIGDAEDQLKNVINDPDLNLAQDIEIVPSDEPVVFPIVTDRLAEIQTAINYRPELQEARLTIENARIAVGVARNQLLPKLDALFRINFDGAEDDYGDALGRSLQGQYISYFVGIDFEVPIGNRKAEAVYRKGTLQLSQSLAALRRVIEEIILDVNVSVRQLRVSAEQVRPSRESVEAARANIDALNARVESFDPPFLDTRLSAQETLANSRRALLQALVNYNIALANMERAKGTILKFYNIVLTEDEPSKNGD